MTNHKFSGHETFFCKHFWPKKGYDFLVEGNSFTDDDAVVKLGVGKNMVTSIRFWLSAMGLINENDNPTKIAELLFSRNGYDSYLEDIGTIWLLHYLLIKTKKASIYDLFFNDFAKGRNDFTKAGLKNYLKRIGVNKEGNTHSDTTLKNDINTFIRNYCGKQGANIEDEYSGVFLELSMLNEGKSEQYFIERKENRDIPKEIILFTLLNNKEIDNIVTMNELVSGNNSIGSIFLLNKEGIYNAVTTLVNCYDFLSFSQTSGSDIIVFRDKPDPFEILNDYYGN
jgi:hypothetical protein